MRILHIAELRKQKNHKNWRVFFTIFFKSGSLGLFCLFCWARNARNLLPTRGGAEEEIFDSLRKVQIKIVVKQITSRSIFGSPNSPLHSKNNNLVKFQNFLLPSPLSLSPFFEIISFYVVVTFYHPRSGVVKLYLSLLLLLLDLGGRLCVLVPAFEPDTENDSVWASYFLTTPLQGCVRNF